MERCPDEGGKSRGRPRERIFPNSERKKGTVSQGAGIRRGGGLKKGRTGKKRVVHRGDRRASGNRGKGMGGTNGEDLRLRFEEDLCGRGKTVNVLAGREVNRLRKQEKSLNSLRIN